MGILKSILKFWLFILLGSMAAAIVAKRKLPVVDDPNGDEVKLVAIFDGADLRSNASAFRGGSAIAGFGGIVLDLRRAQASPDGAHLDLNSVFGGIEVVVPDTWHVSGHGIGVAGGFALARDKDDPTEGQPRISVNARAIFGGVAVAKRPVMEAVAT